MTSAHTTHGPLRGRRHGPLLRYRTVDLLSAAMIGVAFGVAYFGYDSAYTGISQAFNAYQPASGLLGGPWLLAGVVGALVVRKPGAALLAELVAANVEYLLGNQWGLSTLVSGLLQGVGVELAFALVLYRRFGPVPAALGGILAAVLEGCYEWHAYYASWTMASKLIYLGCFAVSGAVIAGLLGWLLVRALARAGALDAFAAGRAWRVDRSV